MNALYLHLHVRVSLAEHVRVSLAEHVRVSLAEHVRVSLAEHVRVSLAEHVSRCSHGKSSSLVLYDTHTHHITHYSSATKLVITAITDWYMTVCDSLSLTV